MRSIWLLSVLMAASLSLKAQQDPQFTHNMFNHAFVNPGSYGLSDGITVTGIFREQWLGLKDDNNYKVAPETFLLTADAPVRFLCWLNWVTRITSILVMPKLVLA